MLHFARTKIMEERPPPLVFLKVFRRVFGEKNVASVSAIHHSLRDVKTSAGEIGSFVYIHHATNWPAVNSHPKLQAGMFLERAANLHRALHWRFRVCVKD